MSALAGIWNLDGRPVERDVLDALASGLAHVTSDRDAAWSKGPFGFVSRLLCASPESADEVQPALDPHGNVLLFDGRLDNRDDLVSSLSIPSLRRSAPDSALILEAWCAWGADCLRRFEGEFALAYFDASERTLVLARDPVGCRPLYYHADSGRIVFGSAIRAILGHPHLRAEPNEDLLADFFVLEHLPYDDTGETFFKGIHAVRPGWALRVSTSSVRSDRFWDFDPSVQARYRSYTDYAERCRELLARAVTRRLRSSHPVAIATSGGLDSSAVLCLADDIRRSATGSALLPMSCVLPGRASIEGERLIQSIESARRLRIERVPAKPSGDLRDVEAAVTYSEWPRFDDGWCALRPLFERAHANGARVLLTGHWSDQLLFATGYLSDLFVKGSWRRIASHLNEYARWFIDCDPAYFRSRFRRELLRNVLPDAARARVRHVHRRLTTASDHPIFESALVRRARRERTPALRPRCASAHARNIYQCVRAMAHRLQFEADQKLASSCGVETTTPFLDRDVIQYLMSIPGDVQTRDGVPRALLREAVRGIVPAEIIGRRWRNEGDNDRRRDYLRTPTPLIASNALGFVRDQRTIDHESADLLGLEFWSRTFFSDRLTPPQHSQISQQSEPSQQAQHSHHALQGAVNLWMPQPRRLRTAERSSPTRLRS